MTTVTKESLAELESGARSLKEDYTLAAYKMLLAMVEAEAVCFVSESNLATLTKYRAAVKVKAEPVMVRPVALYRHAQPAQPAQIVPGWIPVSEQMPENKPGCYEYLVFETLNNRVNHDYWNVPDKDDDAFTPFWNYYGEQVTHWMPLPAAPAK